MLQEENIVSDVSEFWFDNYVFLWSHLKVIILQFYFIQ